MRWPFRFGRASVAEGSPEPPSRPPHRDWASLPAIQRVVEGPRLTAPTQTFVESLAGTHEPDLSLEPLGHHVSLDAPAGLVIGLAHSVETYGSSSELVGRPKPRRDVNVQRRVAFGPDDVTDTPSSTEDHAAAAEPETALSKFAVIDEVVPVRLPLTRMADSDAAAVVRLAMPRPAPVASPAPVDEHAAVNEQAATEAAPEPALRPATAQRLTLGQSRRLGLGAPLSPQRAAAVQRAVEPPSLDLAPPARAQLSRHTAGGPAPETQDARAAVGDELLTAPGHMIAPLAGQLVQRAAAAQESAAAPEPELFLARPPGAGAPEIASPPTPESAVQRVVTRPLPGLYSRPSPAPTAPIAGDRPPLLTVRRPGAPVETPAGAADLAPVQRLAAVPAGVSTFRALHEAVDEPLAPEEGRDFSAAPTAAVRPLPPLAPVAATVQRAPATAHDFVAYSSFAFQPGGHAAQSVGTPVDVPVQREPAAGEAPATEPAAAPAPVATAAVAGAEAATAPPGHSDTDLDDLARKLHDRISLNLRRELLIQRERAGLVTDWR